MQLPELFKKKMKALLGAEYEEFLASYEKERHQALRVNPSKITAEAFARLAPFSLRPVPWAKNGFYYGTEDRPGRHPWHEAGIYYIQEPSAMAVAELADARPGERVLDLCAAPGGKTTQLAAGMKGEGLLVSNEIHPARAKILSGNVERMGISHAVVTNETPARLAEHFPAFFDRIVVDAPCSGEGMFRKEEQALTHWSEENVRLCAERQQEILKEAAKMLRPGGILVYSTCTFSPEEDEESVGRFLLSHPEFSVKQIKAYEGFAPGRPEWTELDVPSLRDTFRLWPHRLDGEGHYAAVLEKSGNSDPPLPERRAGKNKAEEKNKGKAGALREALALYETFRTEALTQELRGEPLLFGDQLYLLPEKMDVSGLKVLRPGLHLGTVKKNRFEPSHALALHLGKKEAKRVCSYPADSKEITAWLSGESLETDGENGWTMVQVDGFSIGWGKMTGGTLKNHYPKGLRKS